VFVAAGHLVNLHFIVTDIFMCFHFGLATVEIVESFLPGALLYPPTKGAVSPLGAALGGVIGPIIIYFILLAAFDAAGAFDDESTAMQSATLRHGWGLPAVSDMCVGWSTALIVFGRGHPAITYLLLLAIVEEAFGMVIIASNPECCQTSAVFSRGVMGVASYCWYSTVHHHQHTYH
jgi:NhaA family Na+:H+ antiporter